MSHSSCSILQEARNLTQKAEKDNLTWPDAASIFTAIAEELDEVKTATSPLHREEEIGDVFWSVVGLACHYGIDPEAALKKSVDKFQSRWQKMQDMAQHDQVILADLSPEKLDEYWKKAKISV